MVHLASGESRSNGLPFPSISAWKACRIRWGWERNRYAAGPEIPIPGDRRGDSCVAGGAAIVANQQSQAAAFVERSGFDDAGFACGKAIVTVLQRIPIASSRVPCPVVGKIPCGPEAPSVAHHDCRARVSRQSAASTAISYGGISMWRPLSSVTLAASSLKFSSMRRPFSSTLQ